MSVIAYLSRNSYGQSAEVTHAWLKLAGHFNMESTVAFMTERTVQPSVINVFPGSRRTLFK